MKLAGLLRRERTNVTTLATTTFNAPGIYYPPYGKTVIQLSGQGSPGNASVPGNYSGSNYYTYGIYVPASGGTYANTNPSSGGTYANTNPSTPGNVIHSYVTNLSYTRHIYYSVTNSTVLNDYNFGVSVGNALDQVTYGPLSPYPYYVYNTFGSPVSDTWYSETYTYYGPPSSTTYNPATSGNSNYNPTTPGNPNYNPYYPAYTYYTGVPGNPNYNPPVAGNTAPSYNVIGISLPGGVADSAAPVIGFSTVSIDYSTAGTPVSVPPGGYVSIKNI